jgi:transcriptional regulator with XRE-family HTH domain
MTPQDFKNGLDKLGWKQSDFASGTGVSRISVCNWANGSTPLPVWAQRHLQLLLTLHDLTATLLEPPTKKARQARREAASPVDKSP